MSTHDIIHCAKDLHAADHVSWPTLSMSGMLEHHAIVCAPKGDNLFKIIHLTDGGGSSGSGSSGSSGSSGLSKNSKYSIVEEEHDLGENIRKGNLRRYNHDPKYCNEPENVFKKARSKIGPCQFDLFEYNCEHFARWCKTNKEESKQADVAKAMLTSGSAGNSGNSGNSSSSSAESCSIM